MSEFTLNDVLAMQEALQERYRGRWQPICPETGKNKLLWLVGELGEVIDIVKKNGTKKALADPALRDHLIEEMADVLMYYGDVMLCFGITPEELKDAYEKKFQRNMNRW